MEALVRNTRKNFQGIVTSTKMTNTITVTVERKYAHPRYKKLTIKHKKYHVHVNDNEAKVGDFVSFTETRPISKTVKYRLVSIITKSK
ncbi:MAG: 30S ribosomal protein S17 [Mycoplasmataceae bacterium]|jgi:small subunit ribosomal protein S17|nr:30S ribosomal protein S17 [Mycoplasmataceae bacterium]